MALSNDWKCIGEAVGLSEGRILVLPGEIPPCCYYIEKGTVLAYKENEHGLKHTYCAFRGGDLILVQDLLRKKENLLYYEAMESVRARKISRESLHAALRENPALYQDILQAVMAFNDALLEQNLSKWDGNAASKLSNLLLNLARSYGVEENGNVIIHQKMSQERMAELSGLHRVTVVREMKKMQEQCLVEKKVPWYVIPNVMKLEAYRNAQSGIIF